MENEIEKRIRDYSVQHLKEKLLMDEASRETESLLYFLSTVPKEKSSASFEIKASRGKMEAFSLKEFSDVSVDLLKLSPSTRTDSTAIDRPIFFRPASGNCVLRYAEKKQQQEVILSRSRSHEIKRPGVQFTIETNGVGCELIILTGGMHG